MASHRITSAARAAKLPATRDAHRPTTRPIDVLDYFLQSDDTNQQWTLGGTDVRPDHDPDGTGTRTVILNKFSNPNCYEVYKITPTQLQLRYEVFRIGGKTGQGNWIRRFEETDGQGPAPGAIWMNRYIVPGGRGVLSRYRQDRFVYDPKSRGYVIDKSGSTPHAETYITLTRVKENECENGDAPSFHDDECENGDAPSFHDDENGDVSSFRTSQKTSCVPVSPPVSPRRVKETWSQNNQAGFPLDDVIRLTSQWQRDGMMIEMYDYARGKGLIAWRWLERLSTLRKAEGDTTGRIFHCEEGYVLVKLRGDDTHRPVVLKYDPTTHKPGRRLQVIRFTSYWKPKLGPQWYVIYRDTTKEEPLRKKHERIAHDFALPEWKSQPGATLSDLPYLYTHAPK